MKELLETCGVKNDYLCIIYAQILKAAKNKSGKYKVWKMQMQTFKKCKMDPLEMQKIFFLGSTSKLVRGGGSS